MFSCNLLFYYKDGGLELNTKEGAQPAPDGGRELVRRGPRDLRPAGG
jgi:hypothetical protein